MPWLMGREDHHTYCTSFAVAVVAEHQDPPERCKASAILTRWNIPPVLLKMSKCSLISAYLPPRDSHLMGNLLLMLSMFFLILGHVAVSM